jgi:D-alanyl-D-alanine carboxypeptidase (penicillin-binding protein 5/6)
VGYLQKRPSSTQAGILQVKLIASEIGSERVPANLRINYPDDPKNLILWKLLRSDSIHRRIFSGCSINWQPKEEDPLNFLQMEQTNQKRNQAISFYLLLALLVSIPVSSNCFAEIIKSRAALSIDASTGEILFSKNSNWRLPPASTTKLMTAIVAIENEDLSKVVRISKKASRAAHSKAGFKEGDQVTIEGLLYAVLLKSANDAAVALAEAISGSEQKFVLLMNGKAFSIGAEDTKFINATGLPGPGQYITAMDLSKILVYALEFPKLREIMGTPEARITTEEGKVFYLRSTDKLLWLDDKIIGGKTGYTRRAGYCFACAAQCETRTILVAILGSPSRKKLWTETEKLVSRSLTGNPP